MALSRNACSLVALPDFPEFAQAVRYGVPGTTGDDYLSADPRIPQIPGSRRCQKRMRLPNLTELAQEQMPDFRGRARRSAGRYGRGIEGHEVRGRLRDV